MGININNLTIDNLNLNDYIIKNLKFYLKVIEEFRGICINPNTEKLLTDKEIKDLKQQQTEDILKDIVKIFDKTNTNLTDLYIQTKMEAQK